MTCACIREVVPAAFSMTSRGQGCKATGGHCLPDDDCEARERDYLKSQAEWANTIIVSDKMKYNSIID